MKRKQKLYSLQEAADFLGVTAIAKQLNVSRAAVYNAIDAQREITVAYDAESGGWLAWEAKWFGEPPEGMKLGVILRTLPEPRIH